MLLTRKSSNPSAIRREPWNADNVRELFSSINNLLNGVEPTPGHVWVRSKNRSLYSVGFLNLDL